MPAPTRIVALALAAILPCAAPALAHKAKKNAEVFITNLEDGVVATSPLRIGFGARHIEIAPLGVNVHRAGHHHLLIDVAEPESLDDIIPFDANHLHYMDGETEAVIELPPGEHTLQLILGDEEHQPWGEHLISERVTIRVEERASSHRPRAASTRADVMTATRH